LVVVDLVEVDHLVNMVAAVAVRVDSAQELDTQ
jgi:hypothetical protein